MPATTQQQQQQSPEGLQICLLGLMLGSTQMQTSYHPPLAGREGLKPEMGEWSAPKALLLHTTRLHLQGNPGSGAGGVQRPQGHQGGLRLGCPAPRQQPLRGRRQAQHNSVGSASQLAQRVITKKYCGCCCAATQEQYSGVKAACYQVVILS